MNAEFPRVAIRLNLFNFAREVLIAVPAAHIKHLRLEVRAEVDAVRRIDVCHLHLSCQAFAVRQRIHHLQTIAEDEPVGPRHIVLVEFHCLPIFLLRVSEEIALDIVPFSGFEDGLRAEPFVNEERDRFDGEGHAFLAFVGPFQPRLRVECVRERLRLFSGEGPLLRNRYKSTRL